MSKPTLIFLPGAFHSPACYKTVIESLITYNYKCIPLPLQAVVQQPAAKDLEPDIAALRTVVLKEIDSGNDVVVIAHSWGGFIMSAALNGLGKNIREKEGKKGGVVRLGFICAYAPFENTNVGQIIGEVPEWVDVQEPWVMPPTIENQHLFYNGLPESEAEYWMSQLRPHSSAAMFHSVGSVAWKEIPSSYLSCKNDNTIPVALQESMVKACQDAGAGMEIQRLECGHSPFLTNPDDVVRWVRKIAGDRN